MAVSELQRKKLLHLFRTFYDYNNDGQIEWEDFDTLIKEISGIHGWATAGPEVNKITKTLEQVWEGLQKYADKNKDKQIEESEWFQMWDEVLTASKDSLPPWNANYCNFFFDISDTSQDDILDLEEYQKVYTHFKISEKECAESFNKFSDNGKTVITRAVFTQLWNEYILSNDPNAKGNSLFGPVKA